MAAAAWQGRDRTPARTGPDEAQTQRLQSLYEALVPYFSRRRRTRARSSPTAESGARPSRRTSSTATAALTLLRMPLPAVLHGRRGDVPCPRSSSCCTPSRGAAVNTSSTGTRRATSSRSSVLPPLPTDARRPAFRHRPRARPCSASPTRTRSSAPCPSFGGRARPGTPRRWSGAPAPAPPSPICWRSAAPGSGTTTLLRSIALQALQHGDVLIVEGGGTGEFACLTGRAGVLAVECGLAGRAGQPGMGRARDGAPTDRRRTAPDSPATPRRRTPNARCGSCSTGRAPSATSRRPTAARTRRPSSRCRCATARGRAVTVVVADQLDAPGRAERGRPDAHPRPGRARPGRSRTSSRRCSGPRRTPLPLPDVPPGRGYARLGTGPGPPAPGPGDPGPVRRRDERGPPPGGARPASGRHTVPGAAASRPEPVTGAISAGAASAGAPRTAPVPAESG